MLRSVIIDDLDRLQWIARNRNEIVISSTGTSSFEPRILLHFRVCLIVIEESKGLCEKANEWKTELEKEFVRSLSFK